MKAAPSKGVDQPRADGVSTQRLLVRNTLFLVVAQACAVPLSVLVNVMMARFLGPDEFGYLYLATTYANFGFLAVAWGQSGTLPSEISRNRAASGDLLGSALVWRLFSAPVVSAALVGGSAILGYNSTVLIVLALACLGATIYSVTTACQDAMRGFERTDIAAYGYLGTQLLASTLVIVALFLGGGLPTVVTLQGLAGLIVFPFVFRALKPVGVTALHANKATVKKLFMAGTPFFFFGLTMVLQPSIDAGFLSKLAPEEVVGWHAAARRLVGLMMLPANALLSALYPTLCRLFADDRESYASTTRGALRTTFTLAAPIALGTYLYADLGISIFGKEGFGPAADNLRMLAVFIVLTYVAMPIGTCVLAANRQRQWTLVQALCVIMSLVLDPILVPLFQERTGNGGLGICASVVASECLVVIGGVVLLPKGVLDRALVKALVRGLLAATGMFIVGHSLRWLTPYIAAPISALAYLAGLWAVGGLDRELVDAVVGPLRRRLARFKRSPTATK